MILDTSFLIDVMNADGAALQKVDEIEGNGAEQNVPAMTLQECTSASVRATPRRGNAARPNTSSNRDRSSRRLKRTFEKRDVSTGGPGNEASGSTSATPLSAQPASSATNR